MRRPCQPQFSHLRNGDKDVSLCHEGTKLVATWDSGCEKLIPSHPARFPRGWGEARARKAPVTLWEGQVGRGGRMAAAYVCSPFVSGRPGDEPCWMLNHPKAAAQPGPGLGPVPAPAGGCGVQKRRRHPEAAGPPLPLPRASLIDRGPVVNGRNIGVNELGPRPDNMVTSRLVGGRGRASVSPAIFRAN